MNRSKFAALYLSAALLVTAPLIGLAQEGQLPQVSMVTLQVLRGQDGSESVITPKGDLAPLPGLGVNGEAVVIYMGAQGGFWYTDKNGQTVVLDEAVRQLQARRASQQQAVQVPQYAPHPYQSYQTQPSTTVNNYNSSGSNGAAAAMTTAAAAGMGAMAGATMSHGYYNAPYGTPMYYNNGHPYYYGSGQATQFQDLNQNQQMAMYNHHKVNEQNQQAASQQSEANKQQMMSQSGTNQQARYQQSENNQQGRQEAMGQNQGSRQSAYGHSAEPEQNYQKQQQWYQDQMKQNPKNFQKAESNPFVSQSGFKREGEGSSQSEREGRFAGGRRR